MYYQQAKNSKVFQSLSDTLNIAYKSYFIIIIIKKIISLAINFVLLINQNVILHSQSKKFPSNRIRTFKVLMSCYTKHSLKLYRISILNLIH